MTWADIFHIGMIGAILLYISSFGLYCGFKSEPVGFVLPAAGLLFFFMSFITGWIAKCLVEFIKSQAGG